MLAFLGPRDSSDLYMCLDSGFNALALGIVRTRKCSVHQKLLWARGRHILHSMRIRQFSIDTGLCWEIYIVFHRMLLVGIPSVAPHGS